MEYCNASQAGSLSSPSKGDSGLSDSKSHRNAKRSKLGRVQFGHTRSVHTRGTYAFCRGPSTSGTSTIATVDNVGQ